MRFNNPSKSTRKIHERQRTGKMAGVIGVVQYGGQFGYTSLTYNGLTVH